MIKQVYKQLCKPMSIFSNVRLALNCILCARSQRQTCSCGLVFPHSATKGHSHENSAAALLGFESLCNGEQICSRHFMVVAITAYARCGKFNYSTSDNGFPPVQTLNMWCSHIFNSNFLQFYNTCRTDSIILCIERPHLRTLHFCGKTSPAVRDIDRLTF